jgi:hypothetical protein
LGLAALNQVAPSAAPWLAIIDHSGFQLKPGHLSISKGY